VGTKGYRYKDKQGFPNDVQGKAQAQVKGTLLGVPGLPLTLPAAVQLTAREGNAEICWETVFSTADKNDSDMLKARRGVKAPTGMGAAGARFPALGTQGPRDCQGPVRWNGCARVP